MIYLHELSRSGQCTETEIGLVIAGTRGEGVRSSHAWVWGFPFGVMQMFGDQIKVVVAQYHEYTTNP